MAPKGRLSCSKCNQIINSRTQKSIFCEGGCLKVWHVPKCSTVSEVEYEEIINNSEIPWFCDACKHKRLERRSIMCEVRSNASLNNTTNPSVSKTPNTVKNDTPKHSQITIELIYEEIKTLKHQNEIYQKTISDLKIFLDDYKEIVESITQENILLKNEISKLHDKLIAVDQKIDNTDQHGMANNLVINGVIESENENATKVTIQIAQALNVNLETTEIKSATRKATTNVNSGLPRSIIVQFNNKITRDNILKNKKTRITNKTINNNTKKEDDRTIYISEQLTSRKQYLFKMARDLKRSNTIQFAWVKEGNIFIRRTEDSRIIKIHTADQIKQLQNEYCSDE